VTLRVHQARFFVFAALIARVLQDLPPDREWRASGGPQQSGNISN